MPGESTTTYHQTYHHLLGHTGLRVSPIAFGAMMVGQRFTDSAGVVHEVAGEDAARAMVRRYLDAGGNFIDTADAYANGESERLLGRALAAEKVRDSVVLATKFTIPMDSDDPNARGNGRKHIISALDASLRRLGTDYVDLYWLHHWDGVTPVEEVMSTLNDAIRAGKIRAIGLSDTPAWYVAKAQVTAWRYGWEPVAALQLEYSLIERGIEAEHVPAALDLGISIVPWSPLGGGFLTGKYRRTESGGPAGDGRLDNPAGSRPEWQWTVLEEVRRIADEHDAKPAQVAAHWVARQPGVVAPLVGARNVAQLTETLGTLDIELTDEELDRLSELSRPKLRQPYELIQQATSTSTVRQPRWRYAEKS